MNLRQILLACLLFIGIRSFSQESEFDPVKYKAKKAADRLYNEAIQRIIDEDYHSAIYYLDSVIAAIPSYALAYNEKGKIYFTKERYDDAILEFEKATDLNPDFGEAFFNLAFTAFVKDSASIAQDSLTASWEGFDQAVQKGYNKPQAYYYRGLMKYLEGETEGAIADYSIAIELDQTYAKAYHDRGTAKNKVGDFQGAVYDYRMAVTYDPGMVQGYNNMGDAKRQIGDYQGAERDYTVAINIDSTNYISYNNRGGARIVLGNFEGASQDFSKAYTLNPGSVEVISNMGSLEHNKGNLNEAIDWFNEALAIQENYPRPF
jgi:tetratricopeptide (TPR) repeat protein